ncbi:MAG: hypothetical protein BWY69_01015 [Planctomycetes bacterium ADurb.Bin401]|nr:MAG: hypothetical protein BWY69_01015 [Planctomycetes bacterium ADurb.Bin401]
MNNSESNSAHNITENQSLNNTRQIECSSNRKYSIRKRELLDLIEKIPGRVELLNDKDRAFINLFLASQSFRNIAAAAQVHEATVARRIKKIVKRISDNDFIIAISDRTLTPLERKVLREHCIDGLPMNRIAEKNKISYCQVRKLIKASMQKNKEY